MKGRPALFLAALFLAASGGLFPAAAGAHVGNRLRLGYRPEPMLTALARLTQMYIREASIYTIDLREFKDSASLREAIAAGEVDVAVEYPAEAWVAAPCAGLPAENSFDRVKAYYLEKYGAVWVGMFNLRQEGLACWGPSCIITGEVAGDLAYYTFPASLRKLMAAVKPAEMDEILRKDPAGSDREILRSYLAAKKLI